MSRPVRITITTEGVKKEPMSLTMAIPDLTSDMKLESIMEDVVIEHIRQLRRQA